MEPDTHGFKNLGKHPVAATIKVIGSNHFIARTQHFYNRIAGSLSTAKTKTKSCILQCCDTLLQCITGRIFTSGIGISFVFSRPFLDICAGLVNRGHYCTGCWIRFLSGVYGSRSKACFFVHEIKFNSAKISISVMTGRQ